jgi:hypothetical protein
VLAQAIVKEGATAVAAGANPMDLSIMAQRMHPGATSSRYLVMIYCSPTLVVTWKSTRTSISGCAFR